MVSAVVVEALRGFVVEPGCVVLEVVEDTLDGAVGVLGGEGGETDVLESDVPHMAVGIVVRDVHVGEVVLEFQYLGIYIYVCIIVFMYMYVYWVCS